MSLIVFMTLNMPSFVILSTNEILELIIKAVENIEVQFRNSDEN